MKKLYAKYPVATVIGAIAILAGIIYLVRRFLINPTSNGSTESQRPSSALIFPKRSMPSFNPGAVTGSIGGGMPSMGSVGTGGVPGGAVGGGGRIGSGGAKL